MASSYEVRQKIYRNRGNVACLCSHRKLRDKKDHVGSLLISRLGIDLFLKESVSEDEGPRLRHTLYISHILHLGKLSPHFPAPPITQRTLILSRTIALMVSSLNHIFFITACSRDTTNDKEMMAEVQEVGQVGRSI